ncbi:protein adenylyltransferase SelO family protein, partial [Pseudonocardia pini]|uniref:protein adenylyltransferase SelO family protein n=1 Tax=Pseudonocardia pini TaxID=2758030 RepID=UPI0015F0508A
MSLAVATTLDHAYARAVPELTVPWAAAPAPDPRLVLLNEGLAAELGLAVEPLRGRDGLVLFTGAVPDTVALAYAGHQFGGYSPRLGDGRALLLGELSDGRDLHLKGSGRTPFARGGDGKAPLGPMLREYVVGEAM